MSQNFNNNQVWDTYRSFPKPATTSGEFNNVLTYNNYQK
jgi:hypothetical protein